MRRDKTLGNCQKEGVSDMKTTELRLNWDIIEASSLLFQHLWDPGFLSVPQTVLHALIPPPYLIQTPVTKIQWSVNAPKHDYMTSVWTSNADRRTAEAGRHTLCALFPAVSKDFKENFEIFVLLFFFSQSKGLSKDTKKTLFHVQHTLLQWPLSISDKQQ